MMSKEHVYVITERGKRKIRRLVVKDKSADVLQVFDKHLLPNTEIMVDPGTENNHFKNIDLITQLHEIPGPIHINLDNRFQNTQTVESSHSGIKIQLRVGRGLRDTICNHSSTLKTLYIIERMAHHRMYLRS